MRKAPIQDLARAAMVAAVYTVLTLTLPIPQYQGVQLRLAESLTLLPFLFPWAAPGLIVGCLLANLLGSPFVLDWLFGTLATALACVLTARMPRRCLAPLPPVLCNGLLVGAEIAWSMTGGFGEAFWPAFALNALSVGGGELVVCCGLGVPLLGVLSTARPFRSAIAAQRLEAVEKRRRLSR